MTTTYIAFRSSTALHEQTEAFIRHAQQPGAQPKPKMLDAIMGLFIEESLQTFLRDAAEAAQLSPTLLRIVNMTCQTITKATRLVIGRSIKKMDSAQYLAAANYMASIRQPDPNSDDWFVAYAVDDAFAAIGRDLPTQCRQANLADAQTLLTRYLLTLTDEAIDHYFEQPLTLLGFGPILRSVASAGIETTRKASKHLINSIIPKLDATQIAAAADFQAGLLVTLPTPPCSSVSGSDSGTHTNAG